MNNPILISQALSSLTGALTVFLGVAWMGHSDYALFAVINLASNTVFGLIRVVVFQPALIHFRSDRRSFTPLRYAVFAGFTGAIVLAALGLALGVGNLNDALLLGASLLLPVGQDWLRYRCLARGKLWRTAAGDAARAAVTSVLLLNATDVSPAMYQAIANCACVTAIVVQLGHHVKISSWTSFRDYQSASLLQTLDYVVSTLNSIVPMLILGSLGGGALIGGFRLAQTILGPLNLVFSASSTRLLTDGALLDSHASDDVLVRSGQRLARKMSLLSATVVAAGGAAVGLTRVEFAGVSHEALMLGVVCVGALAVTSGWAGIHNVIMRMLGLNRQVTLGRSAVVGVSWLAFLLGYFTLGVDGSVLSGFIASAVMYPLAFVIPARNAYKKLLPKL